MPIFTVGLVAVPWVTAAVGGLIRSGLKLNCPKSSGIDPAEPVLHESPAPAQTGARSYSGLRSLYQDAGRRSTGLDSLSNETQQGEQEPASTSACSSAVIHRSDCGSERLTPAPRVLHSSLPLCHSFPRSERARENITSPDPERPQRAGRLLGGNPGNATGSSLHTAVVSMGRAAIFQFFARRRLAAFSSMIRERVASFFNMVEEGNTNLFFTTTSETAPVFIQARGIMGAFFRRPTTRMAFFFGVFGARIAASFSRTRTKTHTKALISKVNYLNPKTGLLLVLLITASPVLYRFAVAAFKRTQRRMALVFSQAQARFAAVFFRTVARTSALFSRTTARANASYPSASEDTDHGFDSFSELEKKLQQKVSLIISVCGPVKVLVHHPCILLVFFPGNEKASCMIYPQPGEEFRLFFPRHNKQYKICLMRSQRLT